MNAAVLCLLALPGAPLPAPKPPRPEAPPPAWKDPLWPTLCRFPGPQACAGCVALAEAHVAWLNGAEPPAGYPFASADQLANAREMASWRLERWRNLSQAWDQEHWHPELRRAALGTLRMTLGEDAFRAGRMPCPVPWERFGVLAER